MFVKCLFGKSLVQFRQENYIAILKLIKNNNNNQNKKKLTSATNSGLMDFGNAIETIWFDQFDFEFFLANCPPIQWMDFIGPNSKIFCTEKREKKFNNNHPMSVAHLTKISSCRQSAL